MSKTRKRRPHLKPAQVLELQIACVCGMQTAILCELFDCDRRTVWRLMRRLGIMDESDHVARIRMGLEMHRCFAEAVGDVPDEETWRKLVSRAQDRFKERRCRAVRERKRSESAALRSIEGLSTG
jgi:hypothetical protein